MIGTVKVELARAEQLKNIFEISRRVYLYTELVPSQIKAWVFQRYHDN